MKINTEEAGRRALLSKRLRDLFAEFFQSTYKRPFFVSWSNSSYPNHLNRANCIFSPVITESFLLSDLKTITPTYSPVPDGLPG